VLAQRLARRCWPGPVALVCADGADAGHLPGPARERVTALGGPALRSPAHAAVLHILYELDGPVVLADLAPSVTTGSQAEPLLGESGVLILDDRPGLPPTGVTVVRVTGDRWEVLREGAVTAAHVQAQAACLVVFVCTGNTCRSPLAEALCKKRLADRLGCPPEELPRHGFVVTSAGVAAYEGEPAAESAVATAREHGADLSGHASRFLDAELALQADYLVCMTQGHLRGLMSHYPDLGAAPRLLCPEGRDLDDPLGQDREVYAACARKIWADLEALVAELGNSGCHGGGTVCG
jgi:protein-tyrosine-phosphatase